MLSSVLAPGVTAFSLVVLGAGLARAAPGDPASDPDGPVPAPADEVTASALGVPVVPTETLKMRAEGFSRFRDPATGKPGAFGAYSNGCLVGGMALPRSGPGYELMRLGRNRRYGHPALVAYIKRLAAAARKAKVGTLLVGDLGQPRGGPTPSGHRSHQSGLDVDIGFTRPDWLARRPMKAAEREQLSQVPVVDLTTRTFTAEWNPKVAQLVELAASDPEVDRVFVNPRIKRELCDRAAAAALAAASKPGKGASKGNKASRGPGKSAAASARPVGEGGWLRTVRPWWGHHDHLHVRLKCPPDSDGCDGQPALPAGDGCGEIAWWESEEALRGREPRTAPGAPPIVPPPPPPLPAVCQALLAAPEVRTTPPATAQRPR